MSDWGLIHFVCAVAIAINMNRALLCILDAMASCACKLLYRVKVWANKEDEIEQINADELRTGYDNPLSKIVPEKNKNLAADALGAARSGGGIEGELARANSQAKIQADKINQQKDLIAALEESREAKDNVILAKNEYIEELKAMIPGMKDYYGIETPYGKKKKEESS